MVSCAKVFGEGRKIQGHAATVTKTMNSVATKIDTCEGANFTKKQVINAARPSLRWDGYKKLCETVNISRHACMRICV